MFKKSGWVRLFLCFSLLLFLLANGIGLFAGHLLYEQVKIMHTPHNTSTKALQAAPYPSETVSIQSRFGYPLYATYFPQAQASKTLIFLHGFNGDRSAGLYFIDLYHQAGFNLLLIDLRAHGQSGGDSVTWGSYERYDLDEWVSWVHQHHPQGVIGVHGISMGAATALLHAGLNEEKKQVAFYIADCAYSDFETLLAAQIRQYLQKYFQPSLSLAVSERLLPSVLLAYSNLAAYLHERFTFREASPIRAVRQSTTPILYLHGQADTLIPAAMSEELYQATKGPKELALFPDAAHAMSFFEEPERYSRVVRAFIGTNS